MSGAFSLVSSGLRTQTQEEIVAELTTRLRARFGVNLNTSVSSIMGQIVNEIAELRAYDQQVVLSVYRSFDPNGAVGQALDRICNITGTVRKGAKSSFVNGIFSFSAAGSVSNGDLFKNADTNTIWRVVGGPYSTLGPGSVDGALEAVDPGELVAFAGTTWTNLSVITNLIGFTNPTDDAKVGRLQELDPSLRVRRQIEIFSQGQGPRAAIRAVVSKIDGPNGSVDTVRVDHNPDEFPVGTQPRNLGIPFKAFQISVETTPDPPPIELQDEIAAAILSVLGAGGQAYGTDYIREVEDIEGEIETIAFDSIDQVPVYVKVTISKAGTEQIVSTNIEAVVKAQILATAQTLFADIGRDQLAGEYASIVWTLKQNGQISGVTGVTVQLSRTGLAGPYADPLVIGRQERPNFDTPNIQVVIV